MSPDTTETVLDEASAADAWRASQVATHGDVWTRESGTDGDPYLVGQAAYYHSVATDEPEWSKASIKHLERALDEDPVQPHRARALLGAAHRMAARNFPMQGAKGYLFFGIPNFIRMANIRSSFTHLDRAVDGAPDDPIVRLLRASALIGVPAVFGGRSKGIEDYTQLEVWMASPSSNPAHAPLLESPAWRDEYYLTRARSMEQLEDGNEATKAWQLLASEAADPSLRALAIHRSASLRPSS